MKLRHILFALIILTGLAPATVQANPYEGMVTLSVRPGWQMPDGSRMAALELSLKPGWKTYWRSPGDAGIPPIITWDGSRNLSQADITWPTPVVFRQNGLRSIGYADNLVLPVRITSRSSSTPTLLSGTLLIGICNDICVPVDLAFSQLIPNTGTSPDPKIAAALADRPLTASEAGVTSVTCTIAPAPDGMRLRATLTLPSAGGNEIAVFETSDPQIWASEAKTIRRGNTLTAEVDLIHATAPSFALDRSAIRITVLGKFHAVDIQGCPAG